jgi:hypothetical protein
MQGADDLRTYAVREGVRTDALD